MKIKFRPQTRGKDRKSSHLILFLVYYYPGWKKLLVHCLNYQRQQDICKLSYNKQLKKRKKKSAWDTWLIPRVQKHPEFKIICYNNFTIPDFSQFLE